METRLSKVWQRKFFSKMKNSLMQKKLSQLPHVVIHLSGSYSRLKVCHNKIITNYQPSGCPWNTSLCYFLWGGSKCRKLLFYMYMYMYMFLSKAYIRFFICFALCASKYLLNLYIRCITSNGATVCKCDLIYRNTVFANVWECEYLFVASSLLVILQKMSLAGWRLNISPSMVLWPLEVFSKYHFTLYQLLTLPTFCSLGRKLGDSWGIVLYF